MVYIMEIYVDGGCRGNGQPWAIGAAAACFRYRSGRFAGWTRKLPDYPPPTNQRAEISAIILALELALSRADSLNSTPWLNVKIYSDSRYAIGCTTKWIKKWANNGWINAAGQKVANQDLISMALELDGSLRREGTVEYIWIPREWNRAADDMCNKTLNEMDGKLANSWY